MIKGMPKQILHLNRSHAPTVHPRWVETADERCPLACVWFALPEIDDQDDESESARPAFSWFRSKAGYLLPVHTPPAPSMLA